MHLESRSRLVRRGRPAILVHTGATGADMRRRSRVGTALPAMLGLLAFSLSPALGQSAGEAQVFEGPVPRAECGPGSRPETALQGEITIADRRSGRSAQGYSCNLEQVGSYPGEGAQWQLTWYGDCAYYGTKLSGTQDKRGTIVVDASDRAHPRFSTNLTTPAMRDTWESLKVNQARGLLGGVLAAGFQGAGYFDVYDVSGDCAHPKLLASVPVNGLGHEGTWSPDGKTYYATGIIGGIVTAIDVSDPSNPKRLTSFFASTLIHGLGVSEDGRRLYLAHISEDQTSLVSQGDSVASRNGLGIWDVSEIADRRAEPRPKLVGEVMWNDGHDGQQAIPVTSGDRPYVVFVDELSHGGPRIIDISDETNPRVVSKLKIEIQMPENRELAASETGYNHEGGGQLPFGYNSHYCNTDRIHEPTILACSNFQSGLRVFDIRDVHHPREVAYFNPGGDGRRRPGSFGGTTGGYTSAIPRINSEHHEINRSARSARAGDLGVHGRSSPADELVLD